LRERLQRICKFNAFPEGNNRRTRSEKQIRHGTQKGKWIAKSKVEKVHERREDYFLGGRLVWGKKKK